MPESPPKRKRSAATAFGIAHDILTAGKRLFHTGDFSDLEIRCGQDIYKCHRAIICPQSEFFNTGCSSGFKEAKELVFDLKEDDPEAVKRMMEYIYTTDYSIPEPKYAYAKDYAITSCNEPIYENLLATHLAVHRVAQKYAIPGLEKMSSERALNCFDFYFFPAIQEVVDCFELYILDLSTSSKLRKEFIRKTYRRGFHDSENPTHPKGWKKKTKPQVIYTPRTLHENDRFRKILAENGELALEFYDLQHELAEKHERAINYMLDGAHIDDKPCKEGKICGCDIEPCLEEDRCDLVLRRARDGVWRLCCRARGRVL